jgi:hypothetical protein
MGVALLAGWLGAAASASAQVAPGAQGAGGPGSPPGPAAGPAPGPVYGPGLPSAPGCDLGPPPPVAAPPSAESLPPNAWSAAHPDLVGVPPHLYVNVEYLLWWVRPRQAPPLVTAGSLNDAIPGALGQPGTRVLFGGDGFDATNGQSGGRISGLYWFDMNHTCGIDASAFILEHVTNWTRIGGTGTDPNLVLTRPFFDPNFNVQNADPVVFPSVQGGNIAIEEPRRFWGADANFRYSECVDWGPFNRLTFLAGVRYLNLTESLTIGEVEQDLPDIFGNPGNTVRLQDSFYTRNKFYGGQLGVESETRVGPVILTISGKVAVGPTKEVVSISGASVLTEPDGTTFADNTRGLLVQPTNIGGHSRWRTGVVPELNVRLAWEFNEHLQVTLGYNFLYWSNTVRPGDQIDPIVNVGPIGLPGILGTSPHPLFTWHTTGFWAQGLTAGIVVSF